MQLSLSRLIDVNISFLGAIFGGGTTTEMLLSSATNVSYQLGFGFYITVLNSDVWITNNAFWDGGNWQRVETSQPSFGLNFQNFHPIPGETVTYGVLVWRCVPGDNPINPVVATV